MWTKRMWFGAPSVGSGADSPGYLTDVPLAKVII